MKSFLIIGIGRFGQHLASKLTELGNEVMAVDTDEDRLSTVRDIVTNAQIGDCMDENVLRSIGVANFDVCFVCIGDNFQSSLEITSLLKENGAKYVVSKADRAIHAKFLLRNGADEVVYPERDSAFRAALRYNANHVYDYIELSPEYSISEVAMPFSWIGKTVAELEVRARYNVNILAVKTETGLEPLTTPSYMFDPGSHLIVAGNRKDIERLSSAK